MAKESVKIVKIDTQPAQKSVKDLRNELKELRSTLLNTEEGTEEYNDAMRQAADIQHTLREQMEEVNNSALDAGQIFGNTTKAVGGMIAGFQAATAVMNLFGVENEDVIKSLQKMQQLMAITQALPAIENGRKAFLRLAGVIRTNVVALQGFSKAMIATGIGAFVGALGALFIAFDRLKKKQDEYVEKQKEQIHIQKEEQIKAQEKYNESLKKELELKERILGIKFGGDDVRIYTAMLAEYNTQLSEVDAKLKDQYRSAERLEAKSVYRKLNKELEELTEGSEEWYAKLLEITTQEQKIKDIKPYSQEELDALNKKRGELNDKVDEYTEKLRVARAVAKAMSDKEIEDMERELAMIRQSAIAFLSPKSLQEELLAKFGGSGIPIPVKFVPDEEEEEDTSFEDAFRQRIEGIVDSLRQAYKTQEEQYQEEQNALEVALHTKLITQEEYYRLSEQLARENAQREKEIQQEKVNTYIAIVGNIADVMSGIAGTMDESNKEQFETAKAFNISAAVISTIAGAIGAYTGAASNAGINAIPIVGPALAQALGITNAIAVTASGAAQIAQLSRQQFGNSHLSGGSFSAAKPNTSAVNSVIAPIQYTSDVRGANIEDAIKDTKVYVLESDITDTQNKVQVTESEAKY